MSNRRKARAAAYRRKRAQRVPEIQNVVPESQTRMPVRQKVTRIPRAPRAYVGEPEPAFFCGPCDRWHPMLWRRISVGLHDAAPREVVPLEPPAR